MQNNKSKYIIPIFIFLFAAFLSSCVNPVLREVKKNPDNIAAKDSAAFYLYNKGDYELASEYYGQLIGLYKGKDRQEKVYYYYCYTKYYLNEFITASYLFNTYAELFANTEYTEECAYMSAYSLYMQSVPYRLDQTATKKALQSLQLFINKYPDSKYVTEANDIIRKLRERLAKKLYKDASLYYNISYYKAAIWTFKNLIKEYPDTEYREEVEFKIFKSMVKYAGKSVHHKKEARYKEAKNYYTEFIKNFPSSEYLQEAEILYSKIIKNENKNI